MARATFLNLDKKDCRYKHSRTVVIPVPFDGTSTWQKGASRGPKALIAASAKVELFDEEIAACSNKHGIYTDKAIIANNTDSLNRKVYKRVNKHLDRNKFIALIGGEHSISLGSIQAHLKHYPDLSVLQLDAHADLRPSYHGDKYNHACTMYHVRKLCPLVQVGLRSISAREYNNLTTEDLARIFWAQDIHDAQDNDDAWMNAVLKKLGENVYLTIDLDVFDPSIMPSTGTPEPGGLLWYPVIKLIRRLSKEKTIIGVDIAELCPNSNSSASDFMAAKLLYKTLYYKFGRKI
ncbi:MAG: agmatinase [Mariprofundales bacterium]